MSEKADALAKQLKTALAQRRPRPWKLVLATLITCVVALAFMAWWLYPRPKAAPLQIIGLDTICTPDETPLARAQLLAPPDDAGPRQLGGRQVVFHEPQPIQPAGGKARQLTVESDKDGQASVEWPLAEPVSTEFMVLHVDPDDRKGSPRERGRIFVWPKPSPLLIVDADETLIADELDAKAAAALTKARADGWRIVYLALTHSAAHDFRKARGWIEKRGALPIGPVVARKLFTDKDSVDQARRDAYANLQARFNGPIVAVVRTAKSAAVCKNLNLRTVVIDGPAAWDDMVGKLK
jgi:hypothetical protein